MKWGKISLVVLTAVLILIQFIPVDRSNPPATEKLFVPKGIQQVMQRSCFDCHSNDTRWPWYSRVAPVSWLVAQDVKKARDHLNFSEWDKLNLEKKQRRLGEIVEEIENGKMPMPIYLILHGDAKVSDSELDSIRVWVEMEKKKYSNGPPVSEENTD